MTVTVVVADAQRLFADALAHALERRGWISIVRPHPGGAHEAITAACEHRPDVALVDYWLDGLPGPDVIRALIACSPGTRVLSLSWFHGPSQVAEALAAGAAGFVPKHAAVADVVDAIRRAHAGERPVLHTGEAPRAHGAGPPVPLSPRELEVLRLVAAGRDVPDISVSLRISRATVRTHIQRALEKTGTKSRVAAVAVARSHGLVP